MAKSIVIVIVMLQVELKGQLGSAGFEPGYVYGGGKLDLPEAGKKTPAHTTSGRLSTSPHSHHVFCPTESRRRGSPVHNQC